MAELKGGSTCGGSSILTAGNAGIILPAAFSPKTLVIPGGTDYASGILYFPTAAYLTGAQIYLRSATFTAVSPSSAATILINKVSTGGTVSTLATISSITVANTTYSMTTYGSILAGEYVFARFSGSNYGVDVANVIPFFVGN